MKKILIAIDGPSASGKGTIAQKIAHHYNLQHLNTGAIYRAVALRMILRNISIEDLEKKLQDLTELSLFDELENPKLFDEEVGAMASIIAKNFELRKELFIFQKKFIENAKQNFSGAILDGRDTTTIICPEADFKFFITADVEIRASRRQKQLPNIDFEVILNQLKQRDFNDYNRQIAPLKIANDAIIIDTSSLTILQVFNKIINIIDSKLNNNHE